MSNNHHSMDEDNVNDFLYGSDAPEDSYGTTTKLNNKKKVSEDDDEIYEQYNEQLIREQPLIQTLLLMKIKKEL
ncbi:unnamed protein product [Cunninghamella echinulata]